MQHILIGLAALVNVGYALESTVCYTSTYDVGTVDATLVSDIAVASASGSFVSRILSRAVENQGYFQGSVFTGYATALESLESGVASLSTIGNADLAAIIDINANLVYILDLLAHSGVAVFSTAMIGSSISSIRDSIILENAAINSLLSAGGVSCDKQNSLNSLGSDLSSAFSAVATLATISDYLTSSVTWIFVDSVTCLTGCTTFTVADTTSSTDSSTSTSMSTDATTTSTDSTTSTDKTTTTTTDTATSSTTSDETTSTSSSTSATSSSSTDSTSSTSSTSTDSTANTSTSSAQIISSISISGIVERCIVRPTN